MSIDRDTTVTRCSAAQSLGDFIAGSTFESVPSAVMQRCQHLLLDTIGVGVAGMGDPVYGVLNRWLDHVGPGRAAVYGGRRLSSHDAAYVNGTLMHVLEFDDMRWPGHGSSSVAPAALGAAQGAGASGRQLLLAFAVGLEVFGSMPRHKGPKQNPQFHSTSVYAVLAAALAAAKALDLTPDACASAAALGCESGAGFTASFGSMALGMHAGHAAAAGVHAAELGQAGAAPNDSSVDGTDGYDAAYFSGCFDWPGFTQGLGSPYVMETGGPSIRQYAAAGATHKAIAGLIKIMQEQHLSSADITTVEVHIHPMVVKMLRFDWPANRYQAKLSMAFNMAATLLGWPPDPRLSEAEPYGRADFRAAREQIEVHTDRPVHDDGARVVVHARNGACFAEDIDVLHGSPADPLSADEVTAKFYRCTQGTVPRGVSDRMCAAVLGLQNDDDGNFRPVWDEYTRSAARR